MTVPWVPSAKNALDPVWVGEVMAVIRHAARALSRPLRRFTSAATNVYAAERLKTDAPHVRPFARMALDWINAIRAFLHECIYP